MNTIELKSLSTTMPVIGFNYDEIKSELVRLTEKYQGLIVTAETLKSCKTTQRELASLRKQINTYMVKISREVKQHVEPFRDQCKELIAVVLEVESPIKESLVVFETERKENQRLWVVDIVNEMIEKYRLGDNYSSRIVTEERFLNATITEDEVVNNIESQAKVLSEIQNKVKDRYEMLISTIKMNNEKLITPFKLSDFGMMQEQIETLVMEDAIATITKRASDRYNAENKAQEVKPAESIGVEEVVTEKVVVDEAMIDVKTNEIVVETYRITLKCTMDQLNFITDMIQHRSKAKIESVKRIRL